MTLTMYGIRNCDTIAKARAWLDARGIDYAFHDYKRDGVEEALLRGWVARIGWGPLLNTAGTTFRRLPEADKTGIDSDRAVALMLANPSIIKRPVLDRGDALLVGFAPDRYAASGLGGAVAER